MYRSATSAELNSPRDENNKQSIAVPVDQSLRRLELLDMPDMAGSPSLTVVLFSSDLMLISTVGGTATAAGHEFCSVTDTADLVRRLADCNVLLCLDLSAPAADPHAIANQIPVEALRSAIAFGPHVHTARLDAARQAGFGRVFSRGQFVTHVADLIAGNR